MGAQNHVHDWASAEGGWVCVIPGCSARMSDVEVGLNVQTGAGHTSSSGNLNIAWKKIHG